MCYLYGEEDFFNRLKVYLKENINKKAVDFNIFASFFEGEKDHFNIFKSLLESEGLVKVEYVK